jgi:tetratricopeptide (TPR) repeat protein
MTDKIIQRATLLIEHKRFPEAERELLLLLASEPNHPYALALIGLCKMEADNHDEAITYFKQALGQQPDNPYFLYLMGLAYLNKENVREALKFIESAISFDPQNDEYYGAAAMIKLHEKRWEEALAFANRGLEANPENLTCLNARSTALLKLDRKDESYETIKEALHNDPHNAHTHANLGWGMLEKGDQEKALESFREALKLNPNNEYARAGLVEALKARYWFYRMWLKYVFWMTNLSAKYQWFFIIGIWGGVKVLNYVGKQNPDIEPFVKPLVYAYTAFALSTWVVDPLSNLFLRFNIYGRYALTKDQTKASTFTGIGFAIVLLSGIGWLLTGGGLFVLLLIWGFGFMLLLGSMFNPKDPGKRKIAMLAAITLVGFGIAGIAMTVVGNEAGSDIWTVFLFGAIAYQWILNAMLIR